MPPLAGARELGGSSNLRQRLGDGVAVSIGVLDSESATRAVLVTVPHQGRCAFPARLGALALRVLHHERAAEASAAQVPQEGHFRVAASSS